MTEPDRPEIKKPRNMVLRLLGPGLVTGAADDDPSGIATYSQAGAQFGYGLLWTSRPTSPRWEKPSHWSLAGSITSMP
jgi:hypothetical protein